MKKAFFLPVVVLVLASCVTRFGSFTMVSTKTLDLSRAGEYVRDKSGRVEGIDFRHLIIVFPLGNPSLQEAVDQAIESIPGGVALVDATLSSRFWYIPYIYGRTSYVVEGTVLVDPKLVASAAPQQTGNVLIYMDKEGNPVALSLSDDELRSMKELNGLN